MNDLAIVVPEVTLLALACGVLIVDVWWGRQRPTVTFWAAVVTGLVVLTAIATGVRGRDAVGFSGAFKLDLMASALKAFIMALTLLAFFYARDYFERRGRLMTEYFVLGLFAVLGMMIMVSANSLLTIYLGLELLSLALYAMVAMDRDSGAASEAAMKYFVLGAIASGMLLYGMSMLYGVAGTLALPELAARATAGGEQHLLLTFGLVFVTVGIAFKFGAVPFHMWVPDVYQGAATPVTLFISTAPKLAAFAMAVRLLVDGLAGLAAEWQMMLILLAVVSMALGNIVAIAQTNMKRMLAYSTIAHMGYLLLGILSATASGYAASMFYAVVYALMSMGAFGALILLTRGHVEADQLSDFNGLAKRSPWFAFIMLILMFSLAGVPPFAGFWAKWFVLKEVIASGHVWLAVAAVVFSLIGAFYYLRIVKLMFFDEPRAGGGAIEAGSDLRMVLSVNGLAILALGVAPGTLMTTCVTAMRAYLH